MRSRLETDRPERLVDSIDPLDLPKETARLPAWSDRAARAVDYLLTHWTAQHAARRDPAVIAELESSMAGILEETSPPPGFADRWRALYDALEARRRSLADVEPERIVRMRHVEGILEHLREQGPKSQIDLIRELELPVSRARMSQIVSLMETNGLIEVSRHGRETRVSLPASATASSSPTASGASRASASAGRSDIAGAPRPRTTRSLLNPEPRAA